MVSFTFRDEGGGSPPFSDDLGFRRGSRGSSGSVAAGNRSLKRHGSTCAFPTSVESDHVNHLFAGVASGRPISVHARTASFPFFP
eukprot:scaffold798_cov367-Pavlova_lutheri.AAC.16